MQFRIKPVAVEAVQWTGSNTAEVADFVGGSPLFPSSETERWVEVPTPGGVQRASEGDWIVRGGGSEIVLCKPDAFAAAYYEIPRQSRPLSEKVVVCYLSPSLLHAGYHESLMDLLLYDMAGAMRVVSGGGRLHIQAGANLAGPRNSLVRKFLNYGQADWMWMVDSDMTFERDTLERLLEHADPERAPIVGGLCFGFDDAANVQPTLFGLVEEDGKATPSVIRYHEWPPDSMFQVAGTGTACLLIHKTVFERMRDVQVPGRDRRGFNTAFPWFQETEHDGGPVGEDLTFCFRAAQLGIPVFVNTGVQLGHIKERELTMDAYFAQRGLLDDKTIAAVLRNAEVAS